MLQICARVLMFLVIPVFALTCLANRSVSAASAVTIEDLLVKSVITPDSDRKFYKPETSIIVSWKTSQPVKTLIEFGTISDRKKVYVSSTPQTSHIYILNGLESSEIYHITLYIEDSTGNLQPPIKVVTPKVHLSSWELVSKNIWGLFSFMKYYI